MAGLSFIAKKGAVVVYPRTICCQQWNDIFGMVVTNIGFDEKLVEKVLTANNEFERLVDPYHIVRLNSPVSLCDQFKCNHFRAAKQDGCDYSKAECLYSFNEQLKSTISTNGQLNKGGV